MQPMDAASLRHLVGNFPYEFKRTATGASSFNSELEQSGANPPILDQCFDAYV